MAHVPLFHRRGPMSGDRTLSDGIGCASSHARAPASILTDAPSGCTLHNAPLSRTNHTMRLPPLTRQPEAHSSRPAPAKHNVRSRPPGSLPVPLILTILVLAPAPTTAAKHPTKSPRNEPNAQLHRKVARSLSSDGFVEVEAIALPPRGNMTAYLLPISHLNRVPRIGGGAPAAGGPGGRPRPAPIGAVREGEEGKRYKSKPISPDT
jgi:hypothetical protein